MKDGQKDRALIQLKQKKFVEKEITKAEGAQTKLQEVMMNIESTAADAEIFAALKQGDEVLTDLQKQVSMEDWDELYDKHQDHVARHEMEVEMFGEALDNDALANELDALEKKESKISGLHNNDKIELGVL